MILTLLAIGIMTISYQKPTMIEEVPYHLFDDPAVEISTVTDAAEEYTAATVKVAGNAKLSGQSGGYRDKEIKADE